MITINGVNVDKDFIRTKFPNGEIGFQLKGGRGADIVWAYQGDHELVHLKMLADHTIASALDIKYMPYSRMDRVKGDWAFTLKTVANLINDMGFFWVTVAEPHSDVCIALLNNAEAYYPTAQYFNQVCEDIGFVKGQDYIVFPDAGAEKRYGGMYEGQRTLVGIKSRDFQTGKITTFNLYSTDDSMSVMSSPRKAIIIDDLCSFGGTFLATAESLQANYGVVDVTLLAAHLETSVHKGHLLQSEVVKRVYATKSIYNPVDVNGLCSHPKIKIYEANPR